MTYNPLRLELILDHVVLIVKILPAPVHDPAPGERVPKPHRFQQTRIENRIPFQYKYEPMVRHSSRYTLITLLICIGLNTPARAGRRNTARDELVNEATAAITLAPKDNEVCFSPDEHCDTKLVKFIESAKKSIDMAIYDINLDQLVHALAVQSKKVTMRIVVDERQAKGRSSAVRLLLKAGVEIRFGSQRGIMHNKFTIIDGERIELGSFNYTHHAYSANQENQLYLSTSEIVVRYRSRFEKMWKEARAIQAYQTGLEQ